MSVQPVKYTEKDVVPVQPGDLIPGGSMVFRKDGGVQGVAAGIYADNPTAYSHYAPAPILDLPEPPKEIPFGEAMERIKDGDRIGWKRGADLGQVVYLKGDNLMVSRPLMPDTYVTNFGVLVEGTFYEIPESTEPESKTTGLRWWEAIEAVRGTDKWARHKNAPMDSSKLLYAKWDGNVLRDARGELFHFNYNDVTAEWEIVE